MSEQAELAHQESALTLVPEFAVPMAMVRQRIAQLQEFVKGYMIQGEDYGTIPGTPKPTLLKPGAEKLCDVYALSPSFEVTHRREDWDRGLFAYEVQCTLTSRRTGIVICQGVGSCNSMESRYRDRWVPQWKLAEMGIADVAGLQHREKENQRGSYREYKVENPDPYTLVNTVLKMAKKRAHVDAVLSATRSSGIFTQDIEDSPEAFGLGNAAQASQGGGAAGAAQTTRQQSGSLPAEDKSEDGIRRAEVWRMLTEMSGGDQRAAFDTLEAVTAFEGKDGPVQGVRSVSALKGKRLQVTYGKVKGVYEPWQGRQAVQAGDDGSETAFDRPPYTT